MYQIGAMRAIKEYGLWSQTESISSCSIGAVNAVLLSQHSIDKCYELWMDLSRQSMFENIDQYSKAYLSDMMKEWVQNDGVDFNPFILLLREYIDENKVRESKRKIIISLLNQTQRRQEYHALSDIPKGALIDYISASARLPFFKPVYIDGYKYLDGGIGDNHPYYTSCANTHFDLVIKIKVAYVPFFIPGLRKKNITFDKEIVIEPSSPIGTPMEFRKPTFEEKYEMGYRDAISQLQQLEF